MELEKHKNEWKQESWQVAGRISHHFPLDSMTFQAGFT